MLEAEIYQKAKLFGRSAAAYHRAVQIEDDLIYSEPPDWALPPRPYLGNMLLEAGRAAEAEKVYREDLKRHRANGWSLFGLEKCLRKQGKTVDADKTKVEFEKAWSHADVKLASSRF